MHSLQPRQLGNDSLLLGSILVNMVLYHIVTVEQQLAEHLMASPLPQGRLLPVARATANSLVSAEQCVYAPSTILIPALQLLNHLSSASKGVPARSPCSACLINLAKKFGPAASADACMNRINRIFACLGCNARPAIVVCILNVPIHRPLHLKDRHGFRLAIIMLHHVTM